MYVCREMGSACNCREKLENACKVCRQKKESALKLV